MTAQEIAESG